MNWKNKDLWYTFQNCGRGNGIIIMFVLKDYSLANLYHCTT
jgi:hypothetical protein